MRIIQEWLDHLNMSQKYHECEILNFVNKKSAR